MKDIIIVLEEYKRNIKNKQDLDNGTITLEELSLDELEGVSDLYKKEIISINREIEQTNREIERTNREIERKNHNIEKLKQQNMYLRKLIRNGDK